MPAKLGPLPHSLSSGLLLIIGLSAYKVMMVDYNLLMHYPNVQISTTSICKFIVLKSLPYDQHIYVFLTL